MENVDHSHTESDSYDILESLMEAENGQIDSYQIPKKVIEKGHRAAKLEKDRHDQDPQRDHYHDDKRIPPARKAIDKEIEIHGTDPFIKERKSKLPEYNSDIFIKTGKPEQTYQSYDVEKELEEAEYEKGKFTN